MHSDIKKYLIFISHGVSLHFRPRTHNGSDAFLHKREQTNFCVWCRCHASKVQYLVVFGYLILEQLLKRNFSHSSLLHNNFLREKTAKMRGTEPNVCASEDGSRWGEPKRNDLKKILIIKYVKLSMLSSKSSKVKEGLGLTKVKN